MTRLRKTYDECLVIVSPESHALRLRHEYGTSALQKAKDKLADQPFLVNGNTEFWTKVVEALENP